MQPKARAKKRCCPSPENSVFEINDITEVAGHIDVIHPAMTAAQNCHVFTIAAGILPAVEPGILPGGNVGVSPSIPRPEMSFRAARCRPLRQPGWPPLPSSRVTVRGSQLPAPSRLRHSSVTRRIPAGTCTATTTLVLSKRMEVMTG